MSPMRKITWDNVEMPAAEAARWADQGDFRPDVAERWYLAGFSLEIALEYIDDGYTLREAMQIA